MEGEHWLVFALRRFLVLTEGSLTRALPQLNPVTTRSFLAEGQVACWCNLGLGPDTWAGGGLRSKKLGPAAAAADTGGGINA